MIRSFLVYYIYLSTCYILDGAGLLNAGTRSQQRLNFFFFANYGPYEGVTGVLWSLGVEKQFYMVWPVAFTLLRFFLKKS